MAIQSFVVNFLVVPQTATLRALRNAMIDVRHEPLGSVYFHLTHLARCLKYRNSAPPYSLLETKFALSDFFQFTLRTI